MIFHVDFKFDQENFDTNFGYFKEKVKVESIDFKPGVNLLVGPNGSGKTSIINILREVTFCRYQFKSSFINTTETCFILNDFINTMRNVNVIADYNKVTFNLNSYSLSDRRDQAYKETMCNMDDYYNQLLSYSNHSDGENISGDLSQLFNIMFGKKISLDFPMDKLEKECEDCNGIWEERYKFAYEYFQKHNRYGEAYTLLMDEPDKGLDIEKIDEIIGVFNYKRNDIQTIASVHNPFIILSCINNKDINFIETQEGYLDKIKDYAKKNLKDFI